MFHSIRHVVRWSVTLVAFWAMVVYGLPWVRSTVPGVCASWKLSGGVCGPEVQNALAIIDRWVDRYLRPLPRDARFQRALVELQQAFRSVEQLVRQQVGDERVSAALRGAEIAFSNVEELIGETGLAQKKLSAVPENAQELLGNVERAFGRLRNVLKSTGQRAEEVSSAIEETRKALDALSGALPGAQKNPAASPPPE